MNGDEYLYHDESYKHEMADVGHTRRTEGIRYRKNELYLDIIKSVNMLVGAGILCLKISNLTLSLSTQGQLKRERRPVRDTRRSKWKTSSYTNASGLLGSKMAERSRSSHRTALMSYRLSTP